MTHTQLAVLLLVLLALAAWAITALCDENKRLNQDLAEMRKHDGLKAALGEPKVSTRQGGKL